MFNLVPRFNIKKFDLSKPKKKKVSKKETIKKSLEFNFGEQDQVDFISYSGLEENSTYLQMGDKFVRTLFISGFPFTANTGWLNMLINFNHNVDISYHIEQIDAHIALPKLNRKITELESTKRTMLKAGKVIGSEITDPLESDILVASVPARLELVQTEGHSGHRMVRGSNFDFEKRFE